MKYLLKLSLFVLLVMTLGCNKQNNCGECLSPPIAFQFEIIDKETGENLFTNGTYDATQITVVNTIDNKRVDFTFENKANIIRINSIGWQSEVMNVLVKVSDKNIFNLFVDAERVFKNCCAFTEYNEIQIENSDFEFDNQKNIYRIKVE